MKFNLDPTQPTQSDIDWHSSARRESARDYLAARRPERLDGGPFRGGKFAVGLAIMGAIAQAAWTAASWAWRRVLGR